LFGERRKLLSTGRRDWIGHILRDDGLLKEVIEGRMEGKITRERNRMGMIDELMDHYLVRRDDDKSGR